MASGSVLMLVLLLTLVLTSALKLVLVSMSRSVLVDLPIGDIVVDILAIL